MQLLVFVAALLVSATFTRWVRDFSNARGWASSPNSDRHVHTRPIPRLGGVAVFLTLRCIVLLAHWLPWNISLVASGRASSFRMVGRTYAHNSLGRVDY
jgi:UDP-N-acetylmuramyl pentapeptide phosphotransferase/UDP-N-acetylglucosamine-1-phosphate transferase